MSLEQIRLLKREGDYLKNEGKLPEAIACYRKAIELKPFLLDVGLPAFKIILKELALIHSALGQIYYAKNQLGDTLTAFLNAANCDPDNCMHWIHFARCIQFVTFSQKNDSMREAIFFCLCQQKVNPQHLAFAGISLIKLDPLFLLLYSTAEINDVKLTYQTLSNEDVQKFLQDPLFLALLSQTIIPDPQVEILLTFLRRIYLAACQTPSPDYVEKTVAFIGALADQCQATEYVYRVSKEEISALEKLNLQNNLHHMLFSCYYSSDISEIKQIEKADINVPTNAVSQKIQVQYEANPYPRWNRIDQVEPVTLKRHLEEIYPNQILKSFSWPSHPRILIAGCGTGFHAINSAATFKNSHVLGVDLSASSLVYAKQKAQELNVANVEFIQGDILDLSCSEKFDIIECSGVLHHMEDPMKGWKILRSLLKDNAWMLIGLYSDLARKDIKAARKFIAENHYQPTVEDIRQCRQDLLNQPQNTIIHQVTESVDFYSISSCRDLLFNAHEVCFSLPEISKAIKSLNLEFLGFCFNQSKTALDYISMFPADPEMKSIENWHLFELQYPHTFIGMYQFWLKT